MQPKTLSTMTKAELVKAIAAQTGAEAVTVSAVVEQMMEEIRRSMIGGENVYLRGFGSFILKHRAQKVARNIAKNTSVTIPAHNVPAFKPSKEFLGKVK
ncbi:HU family DNA-binding protein [Alistipes sp.]|uniref:HU family DNA-binding protein n=1 Tax=Alistipes sp. TaxID=1872444 RepID=UPI003A8AB8F5